MAALRVNMALRAISDSLTIFTDRACQPPPFWGKLELESREIFNPPAQGPVKITPQAESTSGSGVLLRHGRGGVGPSGITCDRNLLEYGMLLE